MSTNVLDKVGSIGAVIAGAAVPCCFPFLSLIGSILGFSFLAPYERYVMWAMQVLVLVALVGTLIAYRAHRKLAPVVLGILSTASVLYAVNTDLNIYLLYGGLAGLLVVAVWNSIEGRRCTTQCKIQ
ncbi:MAG: MerC family mercury resistance protein [Acidobacteriota bacterium]